MQIVGPGDAKELFYKDSRVKQAYENCVYMLLTCTNTYTGIQYQNDPTIFSFELMVSVATWSCTAACSPLIKVILKSCLHRLALHGRLCWQHGGTAAVMLHVPLRLHKDSKHDACRNDCSLYHNAV